MTARFRPDNTEGYSDADLAALNAAFEEIMNANADLWANDTSPGRDLAFKSWSGYWPALEASAPSAASPCRRFGGRW
jgi:hypothetical protein